MSVFESGSFLVCQMAGQCWRMRAPRRCELAMLCLPGAVVSAAVRVPQGVASRRVPFFSVLRHSGSPVVHMHHTDVHLASGLHCSYALKLLGALLEFNRRWVADVAAAGLAGRWAAELCCCWAHVGVAVLTVLQPPCFLPRQRAFHSAAANTHRRFFEWLSISHPHNNVHNMRLCRLVADARVLPPEALVQLQAVDRVSGAGVGRVCLGEQGRNRLCCVGKSRPGGSRRMCLPCQSE